ncbi:hypothetical protein D3C71_1029230 [compost metagenome]
MRTCDAVPIPLPQKEFTFSGYNTCTARVSIADNDDHVLPHVPEFIIEEASELGVEAIVVAVGSPAADQFVWRNPRLCPISCANRNVKRETSVKPVEIINDWSIRTRLPGKPLAGHVPSPQTEPPITAFWIVIFAPELVGTIFI